jgi:hypothetical protein
MVRTFLSGSLTTHPSAPSMSDSIPRTHATTTIPTIIMNPSTDDITPQFNVVFDDWFATIAASYDEFPYFNSDAWAHMFGIATFNFAFNEDDEENLKPMMSRTKWHKTNDSMSMQQWTPITCLLLHWPQHCQQEPLWLLNPHQLSRGSPLHRGHFSHSEGALCSEGATICMLAPILTLPSPTFPLAPPTPQKSKVPLSLNASSFLCWHPLLFHIWRSWPVLQHLSLVAPTMSKRHLLAMYLTDLKAPETIEPPTNPFIILICFFPSALLTECTDAMHTWPPSATANKTDHDTLN